MWAQMLTAPSIFERCDVDPPSAATLAPGEVLLETEAGGICGSDLPYVRGKYFAHPHDRGGSVVRAPGFPLHEVVGRVAASCHPAHARGDRVVGWASRFDAIAELVVTAGEGLAGYDPSLPPTTAVMLQPLACVLYAVEQLGDIRGQCAAVIGQGPIGLLFSHVLKTRGAASVVGVDRVDRTATATIFGVDEAVTASAEGWVRHLGDADRPSVVIEAVGHQVTTLASCLAAVAFGGQIFYFGVPDDQIYPMDMMMLLRKNLTLRSGATIERRRVLAAADAYLAEHPRLREAYVSTVFAADDAQRAFETALAPRPGQFKIALSMS
ncbi:zinc-binding dehydrogenase [Frankia sp. R82]|uniref:zinc-binding dehydrogenase n=1 Tax=Frankia sp. R82 TaxID=2950553 RepID=UPI0020440A6C|nr:zinc-binding dehydrogenase [Frankia sp. R82]MCM3883878.1 zinc-binding dehydrogenase [Frankia sp. R82]